MFESKYSKVLTIILAIVIIAIIGLLGFLGYDYYQKYAVSKDASEAVDNFQGERTNNDNTDENEVGQDGENTNPLDKLSDPNSSNGGQTNEKKMWKGFEMLGTIEIPATNCKYPILNSVTSKALDTAVIYLYGSGVNQVGNSVIAGHNYRNGLFFSNNKNLKEGDKIYVTDNSGNKLTYTIYSSFIAKQNDTSFYQRDTQRKTRNYIINLHR